MSLRRGNGGARLFPRQAKHEGAAGGLKSRQAASKGVPRGAHPGTVGGRGGKNGHRKAPWEEGVPWQASKGGTRLLIRCPSFAPIRVRPGSRR